MRDANTYFHAWRDGNTYSYNNTNTYTYACNFFASVALPACCHRRECAGQHR